MRFTSILLFGTVGLLITGGGEPDCGGEVQALRMELSAALDELRSSQLEIVRLEEALDDCEQGHPCDVLLFPCDCVLQMSAHRTVISNRVVAQAPWHLLWKSTDTSTSTTSTTTAQQAPSRGPVQVGIGTWSLGSVRLHC